MPGPGRRFEKGNQQAAKGKLFDQTLRRAIQQEDGKRLREAAEQLLTQAAAGEPWAIEMLATRLDGRPPQQIDMNLSDERVEDISDASLLDIVRRGRDGTTESPASPEVTSKLH